MAELLTVTTTRCAQVAGPRPQVRDERLPGPVFTDTVRWQYALPGERADANELNGLTMPVGLAFCGDAFVGGRVHLALEHGVEVARKFV